MNKIEQALATDPTPGTSKTLSRLSLLTAAIASQVYSTHAIFFAHALTPISVYVIDRHTHLHLLSGQVGNIEEVFHSDGLIPTMLISLLVFVLGWMAARGTAKLLAHSELRESSDQSNRYELARGIAASDAAITSNGGSV